MELTDGAPSAFACGELERNGLVSVEVVPNVKAETVLEITLKKVRRGSIVYMKHSPVEN